VKWAYGNLFSSGSSLPMPAFFDVGAMILPKGIVITISEFKIPKNFDAKK